MRQLTALSAILLTLLVLVTDARAQVSHRPTVAVLDVLVRPQSAYSRTVSHSATQATATLLTRLNGFTVKPRKETEQAMKSSFALPLNRREIQIIGKKLDVERVASGEVTEITFSEKPRRVCITFSLRINAVDTGELLNGTMAKGCSPPTVTGTDDALIELAVKEAVGEAFRSMIFSVSLPTATILLVEKTAENGIQVTLNRGERDSLRLGREMIVVRAERGIGRRIGRIRISSMGPTTSQATVIESSEQIKPEDQAIGIFNIKDYQ